MNEAYRPRLRTVLIQVVIYTALALVPVKMPVIEILSDPPHAIVQPTGGDDPELDELVASLLNAL